MSMHAVVIPADITVPVRTEEWPAKGDYSQLEFMQKLVGGFIEVLGELTFVPRELGRRVLMVINKEGKLNGLPGNARATALYRYGSVDVVVGDVFLCEDRIPEMRGFEEERARELARYAQGIGEPRIWIQPDRG